MIVEGQKNLDHSADFLIRHLGGGTHHALAVPDCIVYVEVSHE